MRLCLILACVGIGGSPTLATDWPTYRGDIGRTAATPAKLRFPLYRKWMHTPSHPPRPAWPAPARGSYWQQLTKIEPRITEDQTFHPILADNRLFYASSSDDHLHCLHLETGAKLWSLATDGPLRYAPTVVNGRVYLGGDDGHLRCLESASGQLLWQQRIGPEDRRVSGNGRIISAWPLRGGLVVLEGTVYATAGLFPSQGVYAVALNAQDGSVIWRRILPDSAQGYLLASGNQLIIPTGRGTPVALDRMTGARLKEYPSNPGTYALVTDQELIAGRGNDGSLAVADLSSRRKLVTYQGKQMAVNPKTSFLLGNRRLIALDRTAPKGRSALRWHVDCADSSSLAAGDNVVIAGGDGVVRAFDSDTGKQVWSAPVEGKVLGFALADDKLVLSTDRGQLICFGPMHGQGAEVHQTPVPEANGDVAEPAAWVHPLLSTIPRRQGFGLIAGLDGIESLEALIKQSEFRLVVIDPRKDVVARARKALLAAGIYGHRISVHHIPAGTLPFTDYLFQVCQATGDDYPEAELYRVTSPRGVLALAGEEPRRVPPLADAGSWRHQFADPANTANSGDRRVRRDLALQWFGGPGPSRMVDRHLRAPAPLCADGILVVPGENMLLGVDAFSGTELWQIELPGSQRYTMPYDAGYTSVEKETISIAVRDKCVMLDLHTGTRKATIPVPEFVDTEADLHWGYNAYLGNDLIGSVQQASASRTEPSRELISADYNNEQPLVTSLGMFRLDPRSGTTRWHRSDGVILNPSICVTPEQIYFLEGRSEKVRNHPTGRMVLADLLEDAYLVALDSTTGRLVWEQPVDEQMAACKNILFLQYAEGLLVASGSYLRDKDTWYRVATYRADRGEPVWRAEHAKGMPGQFTHGEQVHHPVVLKDVLVAEPVLYELQTGKRIDPTTQGRDWRIVRPGHSCGTLSGAGSCLFFRANNPTVMDLAHESGGRGSVNKLSPTRPGCWINIIPANGMVLIPEASASCVCNYSLQTSMGFLPVDSPVPVLEEVVPER